MRDGHCHDQAARIRRTRVEDQTMSSPDSVEGLFEVQTTTNQHVDDRHSLESYVELCTDSVPRTVTVFRRNSSQTICLNILSRYFVVHGIIYISVVSYQSLVFTISPTYKVWYRTHDRCCDCNIVVIYFTYLL